MTRTIIRTSRTRRSPQQWQGIVSLWQQSGESARHFCTRQSISYASFCRWRKRLGLSEQQAAPTADFVDLATLAAGSASTWHIVLSLGNGVELTLSQR